MVSATITATEFRVAELRAGLDDLRAAGNVSELHLKQGEAVTDEDDEIIELRLTDITLAEAE